MKVSRSSTASVTELVGHLADAPELRGKEDYAKHYAAETFTQLEARLAAMVAAAVDTRDQEGNTYMESWEVDLPPWTKR